MLYKPITELINYTCGGSMWTSSGTLLALLGSAVAGSRNAMPLRLHQLLAHQYLTVC